MRTAKRVSHWMTYSCIAISIAPYLHNCFKYSFLFGYKNFLIACLSFHCRNFKYSLTYQLQHHWHTFPGGFPNVVTSIDQSLVTLKKIWTTVLWSFQFTNTIKKTIHAVPTTLAYTPHVQSTLWHQCRCPLSPLLVQLHSFLVINIIRINSIISRMIKVHVYRAHQLLQLPWNTYLIVSNQ